MDRAPDAVDVKATFVVDRALDGAVRGLAWSLVAADRTCADVGVLRAFPADLNVYAAGQKTLAGGSVHPDVALARVPAGPVLLLALATTAPAAEGDVVGAACAAAVAEALTLAFPQVDLGP